MTEPVLTTPDMEPEEVVRMCSEVYKSFLTPQFVLRNLMKIRRMEALSYVLRGSKAIAGHIFDFIRIR